LALVRSENPTVGIEVVEVSKLDVVLSWLGGLPKHLISILSGFSNDGPQAKGQ